MRMSRKATSGWCAAIASSAAPPSSQAATISSSGQAARQQLHQRVAQQRFVFGDDAVSHGALRWRVLFGTVMVAATPAGKLATMAKPAAAP